MLYAHSGPVRRKQLFADLVLVLWCVGFALLGRGVFHFVNTLRGPAEQLSSAANDLGNRVDGANERLPSFLQGALGSVSGGTDSLGNAANNQADAITHVASLLGWTVALVPIVIAILVAVYFRGRWMLRVRAATAFRAIDDWEELLARRAVMHQPLGALRKVSANPLYDLQVGNFEKLAALELAEVGIHPIRASRKSRRPRR